MHCHYCCCYCCCCCCCCYCSGGGIFHSHCSMPGHLPAIVIDSNLCIKLLPVIVWITIPFKHIVVHIIYRFFCIDRARKTKRWKKKNDNGWRMINEKSTENRLPNWHRFRCWPMRSQVLFFYFYWQRKAWTSFAQFLNFNLMELFAKHICWKISWGDVKELIVCICVNLLFYQSG